MLDARAKPWSRRIGIAIVVMLVIVVGMGGLYKLRRPSNQSEKRKRVVAKDRASWVAKDKISLTRAGPSPTPECEQVMSTTEEMIRFLQHACNQGEGEVDACRHLYYSSREDSTEKNRAKEYRQKAAIRAYGPQCYKGSGDINACEQLYNILPQNSAEKNRAEEYLLIALSNKCDKGLGPLDSCIQLWNVMSRDSGKQKQAEEYVLKATFKTYAPKCIQGSKDSELCLKHYLDINLPENRQANEYKFKEMTNNCAQGLEDAADCLRWYYALPQDFADKKQAKKYWLEAWIRSCENKNQVEYCKALLEISEPEQVPKIKRAADQLLKLCLIEHQYEACSPVVGHYRNQYRQCFQASGLTESDR